MNSTTAASSAAPRPGGFWIRFLAFLLDGVILECVYLALNLFIGIGNRAGNSSDAATNAVRAAGASVLLLGWVYEAATTSSPMMATPGKRICGLKVVDSAGQRISFGRASLRYFSKILSSIMLAGLIMAAFLERKQALHDVLAGTYVVHRSHGQ